MASWIYNLTFAAAQWLSGPPLLWTVRRYMPGAKRTEMIPLTLLQNAEVQEGPQTHSVLVFPCSQAALFQSPFLLENSGQTRGQKVNRGTSRAKKRLELESWSSFQSFRNKKPGILETGSEVTTKSGLPRSQNCPVTDFSKGMKSTYIRLSLFMNIFVSFPLMHQ